MSAKFSIRNPKSRLLLRRSSDRPIWSPLGLTHPLEPGPIAMMSKLAADRETRNPPGGGNVDSATVTGA